MIVAESETEEIIEKFKIHNTSYILVLCILECL